MNKPKQKPLAAGTAKGRIKGENPLMDMRLADADAQPSAKGVRA